MRILLFLMALCFSAFLYSAPPAVYVQQTDMELDVAYKRVYAALEENKFWVVFEANLSERMARFKDKWGDAYNRSNLSGARSMVFCNIWWTNTMASADPDMLALCPLHISLYEKDGRTSVVMVRPSSVAKGSGAEDQAAVLEMELTGIIKDALK